MLTPSNLVLMVALLTIFGRFLMSISAEHRPSSGILRDVPGRPGTLRGGTLHQITIATFHLVSDSLSSIYLLPYSELLTAMLNYKRTKTNKDYEVGITWITDNVSCFQVLSEIFRRY
jgi:hypothetical protein